MSGHYYPGSPGTPGFSPSYRPFNRQESPRPLSENPYASPGFSDGFFQNAERPRGSRGLSKASIEPLIYDYSPTYPIREHSGPPKWLSELWAFIYNWWLCIASLIVSLLALGAIVVFLALVDGRSLPKLPLSITVNTYVSFFGTITKASMLVAVAESISQLKWLWFRQPRTLEDIQTFDDASRGPLGAVQLLLKTKAMKLAALGSLITVLSLVMDPFAQQIVSYPTRSVVVNKATVGTAQTYDAGLDLNTLDGGLLQGPEWGMKAAVYDGMFKPWTANDLAPNCPTGNCTFPLFDTLAVCSKCLDVSNQVVVNNPPSEPSKLSGSQTVSYTIPGGAITEFSVLFQEGNLAQGPTIISTTDIPSSLSKTVLGLQDPLLMLVVYQFPDVALRIQDGNYYNKLPTTHECALYFCVNTYNSTVVNGQSNSTLVSSWTSETGTPTVGGALSPKGMQGTKDAVFQHNRTYTIPAGTLANLKSWLNVTLQGTMNTTFSIFDQPTWANDEIQVLNETTDWDGLFKGIAMAMTTYIRSSGLPGLSDCDGIAHKTETYVRVIWAWMVLPCSLVGLSIIFLVATMMKNQSKSALAWKSSSLALLFHGLEGVNRGADGLQQMKNVARRTRVILNRGADGEWKLVNYG